MCRFSGIRIVSIPVLLFVVVSAGAVFAEEPTIVEEVRRKYENAQTLEAAFDLNIYWAVREKEEKKEGRIWVGPSDKFRAELNDALWVCNGRTFWQYSGHSKQVIIKNLLDVDLAFHPSRILSTYLVEPTFKKVKDDGRMAIVTSVPSEDAKAHVSSITLTIDTKSKDVKQIVVVDKNGNTSTYTFKKIKINPSLSEDTFTFEPPDDAQVLDMRS